MKVRDGTTRDELCWNNSCLGITTELLFRMGEKTFARAFMSYEEYVDLFVLWDFEKEDSAIPVQGIW